MYREHKLLSKAAISLFWKQNNRLGGLLSLSDMAVLLVFYSTGFRLFQTNIKMSFFLPRVCFFLHSLCEKRLWLENSK